MDQQGAGGPPHPADFEDVQECGGRESVAVLTSGVQMRGRIIPETVTRDPPRRRIAGS
jgi:hypothetical protein